jgi:cardiolipin synthase A/B
MLHAKTAVADGRWARVGSSNLNVASWLGNFELDAVVEDVPFAQAMAEQYTADLSNATEVLLRAGRRRRPARRTRPPMRGSGSAGRAVAGAVRLGNTVTAAVTNHRVLAPADARILATIGAALVAVAVVAILWPRLLAIPIAVLLVWLGGALLSRAWRLRRRRAARGSGTRPRHPRDAEPPSE